MGEYNIAKMQNRLQKELDEERYRHTLGVMYTAASLAMCYDEDLQKAQVAGLLHDCAKCIPNEKKIRMCEKYSITISGTEKKAPYLLHAKLGAYLAEHKYGVDDPDILGAITWHTTGKPEMSMLEKIIFISDYIEPMRFKAKNLRLIRQTVFKDLDEAVYLALRDTLNYLDDGSRREIDGMTRQAFLYYRDLCMGIPGDD